MAENSKKPRIRFKGFTEAWEQRKYEDLGRNISGGSLSYDDLDENGENNCVLYGELYTHYDCIIEDIQYRTNKQGCMIYKNDVLFPQSTTVDAFSLISPACLNEEKAETGGVFIIRPNKNIDGNFVAYYTKGNTNQRNKLSKKAQGLTIVHLYYQSIKDEIIFIPRLEEQNKISNLFKNLDSLITLHQRKYDKLLNVKKALLEKMFPKNGKNTPEIRFKGFTEAWEQRKLGDCGLFKSNGVDKLSKPEEIPVNLLNYMDVYNKRKITNKNACNLMQVTAKPNQLKDNNVLKGDVFFTPTSETADDIGHSKVIEENLDNTVYSYHLMRYRPHENTFYLTFPNFVFDNNNIYKQMALLAQGVQRFVLSKSQFENISFSMPNIKEQEKISRLLEDLDNIITLHQRECEKLKNVKKSLLEKMFV